MAVGSERLALAYRNRDTTYLADNACSDELGSWCAVNRFGFDSVSLQMECRIQRQRSMPIVLER